MSDMQPVNYYTELTTVVVAADIHLHDSDRRETWEFSDADRVVFDDEGREWHG